MNLWHQSAKVPCNKDLLSETNQVLYVIITHLLAYNETSIIVILWIFEVYKSDVHWKKEWKCYKLSVLGVYVWTNKSDKLENSQDNSILFILIYPYILKISINNLRAYSHFWNFIEKNLIYMKEYWVFENKYESGNKQCRNRGKSARMFHLVTHGASHHSLWNICFYNFPNEYLQMLQNEIKI